MLNKQIQDYLSDNLGLGQKTFQGLKFNCPKCDKGNKYNLEINLREHSEDFLFFNCWACKYKGFIKRLLEDYATDNSWMDNVLFQKKKQIEKKSKEEKVLVLPDNSGSILNDPEKLKYVLSRGISESDILKFNILSNQKSIIFPYYEGEVLKNYCIQDWVTKKYKNFGSISNSIFYKKFINIDWPIILTEGVYDALSVINSIPLLGVDVKPEVYKFCSGKKVILALDNEVSVEEKLKILQNLIYYGASKVIIFNTEEYKDLNEMYNLNPKKLKRNLENAIKHLIND